MEAIKKLPLADKILLGLSFFFRALLLYAFFIGLINKHWIAAFLAITALFFTFLPSLIAKNYRIYPPTEFELLITLFIYMSIFLGEVQGYYTKYWWWDNLLHTMSGVGFGFIGFLMIYTLYKTGKIDTKPIYLAMFVFCFALSIGAVWEIFEFNMDNLAHMDMQKRATGVFDTMADLMEDAAGALFASILGYFYLKGIKGSGTFDAIIKRFIKNNTHIFKEK